MRIRTIDEIIDVLDADLIWRKKELTQFRFLLDDARLRPDRRDVMLRAGVTLLYAHWEGYVKTAATSYLTFVSFQRLKYDELAHNFVALGARSMLRRAGATDQVALHLEVVRFFLDGLNERSRLPVRDGVGTKGNLSSKVLHEIVTTLGLEYAPYETKAVLIDEGLLESRNTVAHGEYLLVTADRWEELYREVLSLMETIRTAISNAVVLKHYRAA
jgi:hypothetical protein